MSVATPRSLPRKAAAPPLQPGDRLSREEFERRVEEMPESAKVELIDGRVYMPPPAYEEHHGSPHMAVNFFIASYWMTTPGVIAADNSSLRLDMKNLPQPDTYLRILESHGGRTCRTKAGYIEGAPELVVEVAASSVSYDLHDKLEAYRRNGVNEYIVWRTYENAINWFVLGSARYKPLLPKSNGVLCSKVFPGLWLDVPALLRLDLARVRDVLAQGVASSEHADFVAKLASAAK